MILATHGPDLIVTILLIVEKITFTIESTMKIISKFNSFSLTFYNYYNTKLPNVNM